MANDKATHTFTQPFGHLPHIILLNNIYYELACPDCGGNVRSDSPHASYNQLKYFPQHVNRIHGGDVRKAEDFIGKYQHRQLTSGEVQKIQAGDIGEVILKKPVVSKDGEMAQVKVSGSIILPHYPTIAQKEDNSYVDLACCFCDGNARPARGSLAKPKLVFLNGIDGLRQHIVQSHQKVEGDSRWMLENCGTPVTAAKFQQLKTDTTSQMIEKVEAGMEKRRGWQRMEKETKAASLKEKSGKEGGLRVRVLKGSIDGGEIMQDRSAKSAPSPSPQTESVARSPVSKRKEHTELPRSRARVDREESFSPFAQDPIAAGQAIPERMAGVDGTEMAAARRIYSPSMDIWVDVPAGGNSSSPSFGPPFAAQQAIQQRVVGLNVTEIDALAPSVAEISEREKTYRKANGFWPYG